MATVESTVQSTVESTVEDTVEGNAAARAPLNRDRVVDAALKFVDAEGIDALSMRKLGGVLGVEAMSLYNHIPSKSALIDAITERLYREVLDVYAPADDWTWEQRLRELAHVYRRMALGHANAFGLMADHAADSLAGIQFLEECFDAFSGAGLDARETALAFNTAGAWVVGAVRQELGLFAELVAGEGFDPADVPPEFAGAAAMKEACVSWTADEHFEFGLDVMIAGVKARLL
jgi:AcrR family transcriptional regulator